MIQIPGPFRALTQYKQFVLWKAYPLPNGKNTKRPINVNTGLPSDAHDVKTWMTADVAIQWLSKSNVADGIGFVFTENDPFFFIDIDGGFNVDSGQWNNISVALTHQFNGCAVEVSMSGTGLHIIGTGHLPPHSCKNKNYKLELYTEKRFCALTGTNAVGDAGFTPSQTLLDSFVQSYFHKDPNESVDEWTTEPVPEYSGPTDDQVLINKMLASSSAAAAFGGRATFRQLWEADPALGNFYQPFGESAFDHNSADLSLCLHLAFWTGKNCERMDRLFRMSGLYRDKWERQNYREPTILKAIASCKDVYSNKRTPATQVAQDANLATQVTEQVPPVQAVFDKNNYNVAKGKQGSVYLSPQDQVEFFKNCAYVVSENKIFTPKYGLLKQESFNAVFGGLKFCLDNANDAISDKAYDAFTKSTVIDFPIANDVCFRPEIEPYKIIRDGDRLLLNTYQPIQTPRLKGDPSPLIDLMRRLFPNDRDREIMLSYMAAIVQYPGIKFQWAPLVQGCEGNGKSLIAQCVAYAVGMRYTHYPQAESIHNEFNAWLYGKLLIVIEEVYVNDSRHKMDTLKWMITNLNVPITPKGVDQVTRDNRANFMCNSNHKNAVRVARKNNRRWCIFYTPQQDENDLKYWGMLGDYFPKLWDWCNAGGFAVVSDFLHGYQIPDEFNPATTCKRAPKTTSTDEAQQMSLGMIEQEIVEAIGAGRYGFSGDWVSSMALDRLLESNRFKVSRQRRLEMLKDLGYIKHPGLNDGRVDNNIPIENGKPRLYVRENSPLVNLYGSAAVVSKYLEDQGVKDVDAFVNN